MQSRKKSNSKVTTDDIKITSVQPVGKHSLMIILPKGMCTSLDITADDAVQIVKSDSTLVVSKVSALNLEINKKIKET